MILLIILVMVVQLPCQLVHLVEVKGEGASSEESGEPLQSRNVDRFDARVAELEKLLPHLAILLGGVEEPGQKKHIGTPRWGA